MAETVKEFFDRFVRDFATFDGRLIASRYIAPYSAVSFDGDIWLCNSEFELVEYFQSLLDRHKSNGVVCCKCEDIVHELLGNSCILASVSWTMMDSEGKTVSHWRESYNLIKTDSGLKIFTSIDHS
jgi:hypothetical protein